MSALKFLHNANPNGRCCLKADGTDIQEGLRESMRNEWSGDVDVGDGKLGSKYSKYLEYLMFVRNIGLNDKAFSDKIKEDLQQICSKLSTEIEFLTNSHADAKRITRASRIWPTLQRKHCLHVHGKWKSSVSCWRKMRPCCSL